MEEKKKSRIWSIPFLTIFLVNFVLMMSQYMVNLLVPKYADYLGGNSVMVGMLGGMFAVTALLIRPVSGPAIHSFSKKRLMIAALLVTAGASALYAVSRSMPLLMAARLLHGVGIGFTSPLGLAIAGETLPDDRMASGVGVFTLGTVISTAVGPGLGLSLAGSLGYRATFFITAGIGLAAALGCLLLPEDRQRERPPFRVSMNNIAAAEIRGPMWIMATLGLGYTCLLSFIALYGEVRGVENVGLFFTVYAMALVVSRPLTGTLADKKGFAAVLIPSFLMFAGAYVILAASGNLAMFLLAAVVLAFGYGAALPNVQSLAMRLTAPERRGVTANTLYMGCDLGSIFSGPLAGGVCDGLLRRTGDRTAAYSGTFLVMAVPALLGLVIYLVDRRARKRSGRTF